MLLPRLITAVIGIPLILLTIFWGGIPFALLMAGIAFMSLREYFIMARQAGYGCQPVIGTVCGMALFLSIYLNATGMGPLAENQGTVALMSLLLIPIILREMIAGNPQKVIERISVTFLGVFFIPWALGHLVLIRNLKPWGREYIYLIFILIWTLDTAAYAVGKNFGRFKLAESISPKKTIEGALGGIAAAMLVGLLCRALFLSRGLSIADTLVMALIIGVVAQFSDLSESLFKRDAGVKDSANLLPGHGGMLDRFDSFLFTAPVLYYFLSIVKSR